MTPPSRTALTASTPGPRTPLRRKAAHLLWVAGFLLFVVILIHQLLVFAPGADGGGESERDVVASSEVPAPAEIGGADPKDARTTPAAAMAAVPIQLTVAAAGIDVPVLPLTPTAEDLAAQSLVPPFTDDGYWISSYGSPGAGSTDTTYITGHSWEGREAPFDRFSTDASVGDEVLMTTDQGVMSYVIDSITTHDKDTLKSSDIWDRVPNRLVIISCYTEDPWGKNVVVTASPRG